MSFEGGGSPRGWEKLWAKDVWGQTELPHGDLASMYRGEEFIRFERIAQPWLKEAAKRWARVRLLADTSPRTMSAYLVGVTHFSQWLAEHAPEVSMPAELSRAVLEDYMLWVRHESPWKPATRNQRLLAVRLLLEEQREDGLAGLPAGAVIHAAELPRLATSCPRRSRARCSRSGSTRRTWRCWTSATARSCWCWRSRAFGSRAWSR